MPPPPINLAALEKRLNRSFGTSGVQEALEQFREAVRRHAERVSAELRRASMRKLDASSQFLGVHSEISRLDDRISELSASIAAKLAKTRREYHECGLGEDAYLRAVARLEEEANIPRLREEKREAYKRQRESLGKEMAAMELLEQLERAQARLPFYEHIAAKDIVVNHCCQTDWARLLEEERSNDDRLSSLLLAVLYSNAHAGNVTHPGYREEVDMDTVAVAIVDEELFVACNFKRRNFQGAYTGFGFTPADCTKLAMWAAREPIEIGRATFIMPNPAPTDAIENATPHAEMQLLSHLGTRLRGVRIGVSKACCINCMAELYRAGVIHPQFAGAFVRPTMNWEEPRLIRTRVLKTVIWD